MTTQSGALSAGNKSNNGLTSTEGGLNMQAAIRTVGGELAQVAAEGNVQGGKARRTEVF